MTNDVTAQTREIAILSELADVNQIASDFYKMARERTRGWHFRNSFQDIEMLHERVTDNILKMIEDKGGRAQFVKSTTKNLATYFDDLPVGGSNMSDSKIITRLEQAEEACHVCMKNAYYDTEVSTEVRRLLARELRTLERTHDYISSLRAIAPSNDFGQPVLTKGSSLSKGGKNDQGSRGFYN